MFNWYKKVVFENYVNFNGRARRSEFWYFILMNMIFSIALMVIDKLLSLSTGFTSFKIIQNIYSLLLFLPGLAVAVRRLHDVGKSGWWMLVFYLVIAVSAGGVAAIWFSSLQSPGSIFTNVWFYVLLLVALGSSIWMMVLNCIAGEQGANKYGSDPKLHGEEINEIGTA